MTSLAPARPRIGLLSRLHCSRSGHHWERQILDSGAEARWVCTTCGKLGDEIPVITPDQEVSAMSDAPATPPEADPAAAETEPGADPAATAAEPEVVEKVTEEGPAEPDVVSAAPSDDDDDEDDDGESGLRIVINPRIVVAVSVIALGAALYVRRRRRR